MRGQQAHWPLQYRFRSGTAKEPLVGPRHLWCRDAFSFGVFLFFFNKYVLLWVVGGGEFHDNWDLVSREILPKLSTLNYEAERTLDLPTRRSRQGTSLLLST